MIKVVLKNYRGVSREICFNFDGYSDEQINRVLKGIKLNNERIHEITEIKNAGSDKGISN